MDDDTFEEEEPGLEDEFGPEADDLEDELDEDVLADDDVDLTDELDTELVVLDEGLPRADTEVVEPEEEDEDEDVLDLEEELHPDDVEAPLDALLQERTASATLEDEEEELDDEEEDLEERGDATAKIIPRRPGEFLCSSCFLVLPRSQLADEARMLCRDCA
jgi:hypothetical protein